MIDCAWQTRITSFYRGAEAAAIIARASCDDRAAAIAERGAQVKPQCGVRPFRFEDLNGAPEPANWGPVYPKTASAAVEKWRRVASGRELTIDERREYGAAVHAWIRSVNAPPRANHVSLKSTEFNAAKHRVKLIAEFAARAEADKRAWALGKIKNSYDRTIVEEYEFVMAAKRS